MKFARALLAGSALAGATLAATPASAITIVLNDIGGVTGTQAELGFRIAASYWESVITTNATIRFDVGFSDLGDDVLGGTSSYLFPYVDIADYYSLLAANAQSALDAQAVANLSPLSANGSVSVIVPEYYDPVTQTGVATDGSRLAPDGKAISNTVALLTSTVKGLGATSYAGPDAEIQFSSTFAFDFDPTDGISAGQYDFIGVAIHEMGHALGFVSGVDDFDYYSGPFTAGDPIDEYWWGYGLDLFRYSAEGQLNWNFDTDSYFSIDGGATAFGGDAYFSTGTYEGNGWQASHWLPPSGPPCNNFVGIMNPYICSGLVDSISSRDLAAFDAIGWNLNVDVLANPDYAFTTAQVFNAYWAAVPEPATWAMMIAGFGFVGASMRRRPRVAIAFG